MTDEEKDPQREGQQEPDAPAALSTYHTDAHLTAQESQNKKDAHAESQESGEGDE